MEICLMLRVLWEKGVTLDFVLAPLRLLVARVARGQIDVFWILFFFLTAPDNLEISWNTIRMTFFC